MSSLPIFDFNTRFALHTDDSLMFSLIAEGVWVIYPYPYLIFNTLFAFHAGYYFMFNLIAEGLWDILACDSNLSYFDIIG